MTQETREVAVRSQRGPLADIAAMHTVYAEGDDMFEWAHLAIVAVNVLANLIAPWPH
jgi:hypothetical protein